MRRVRVIVSTTCVLASAVSVGLAAAEQSPTQPPTAQTVTDFDGDGFADLAIGVPYEDGPFVDSGAIHVFYGTASGLEACCGPVEFWTQGSNGLGDAEEEDDHFGFALATADFNADGYSDLAAGVQGQDVGGLSSAGAVHIMYGTAGGLQATAPDDQVFTQDSPDVADQAGVADSFGFSLAVGDFDADGFDDLAVGIPGEPASGLGGAGGAHIFYGTAGGLQATAPDDFLFHQDRNGVEDTAETGDNFGVELAGGDFDGDGFDDLAVGVSSEDITGTKDGAVNVLYGAVGGLQAIAPADQLWHQDSTGIKETAESFDLFGSNLVAGDFDSDGADDLAVGVPAEERNALDHKGVANVLYGAVGVGLQEVDDQLWHQDSPNVRGIGEAQDWFGGAVAAGDFDADGTDDLAIGAWGESFSGAAGAGAVNVLYGTAGGLQATAPDDQFWSQNRADVRGVAEPSDTFGFALTTDDFDDSGQADLAIGIISEELSGGVGGAMAVLYSDASGLQAVSPDDEFWHQDIANVDDLVEPSDQFGRVLA